MITLSNLIQVLYAELINAGKTRTAKAYRSTYKSVFSYLRKDPALPEVFSVEWLAGYEYYLRHKGNRDNTISFYLRMLRAIYNKAVKRGYVQPTAELFHHVFTGKVSTLKRAINPGILHVMYQANLSEFPALSFCRDTFLLSFYMQGISFIDLAYLRKSDVRGDVLTYRRKKTGSVITIKLLPQAFEILSRYSHLTSHIPYLYPIITEPEKNERLQYENKLRTHNRRLRKLADLLHITDNLTSYVSRHSWATTAYHKGIPTSVISQAMGHRTEEVTKIYLASFDNETLGNANKIVFDAILEKGERGEQRGFLKKESHHLLSDGLSSLQK